MGNLPSTLITLFFLLGFVLPSIAQDKKEAQDPTTQKAAATPSDKKGDADKKNDEPKGEVDLLLEELAKRHESIVICNKCDNSKEAVAERMASSQIIDVPPPTYPDVAQRAHASGEVSVKVIIDTDGKVMAAQAVSGHPLLRAAAVKAARGARFAPTLLEGKPVRIVGVVIYNFVAQ